MTFPGFPISQIVLDQVTEQYEKFRQVDPENMEK